MIYIMLTGFDKEIMKKFKVILATISSQCKINTAAFKVYCLETAKIYVSLYDWYYMSTSVHVILLHGHQVMDGIFLLIGMMSEEAQEHNNKIINNFRECHTRKSSRYFYYISN